MEYNPWNIHIRTRFDIRAISRIRIRIGFLIFDPGHRGDLLLRDFCFRMLRSTIQASGEFAEAWVEPRFRTTDYAHAGPRFQSPFKIKHVKIWSRPPYQWFEKVIERLQNLSNVADKFCHLIFLNPESLKLFCASVIRWYYYHRVSITNRETINGFCSRPQKAFRIWSRNEASTGTEMQQPLATA